MITKNVEKRTWDEFRKTGLFQFVNSILHAFGWVIVVEVDNKTQEVINCFPARTKYRGFDNKDTDDMYIKIAAYLSETAKDFPEEIK